MLLQTHYDVCSIALFPHLSCLPPAATWKRGRKHIKNYDKTEEEVILINNALIWKFGGKWARWIYCFRWWYPAFLSRRPILSGDSLPLCCPVFNASRHVSLQDPTNALIGQIRPAWWLLLAGMVPRAGYWLTVWASFWAARPAFSKPRTSRNFLFNRPNSEQPEKGNHYKISALLPKKITRTFLGEGGVLIHKATTEKFLCEAQLIHAIGR